MCQGHVNIFFFIITSLIPKKCGHCEIRVVNQSGDGMKDLTFTVTTGMFGFGPRKTTGLTLSSRYLQNPWRYPKTHLAKRASTLSERQCRTRQPSCPCVPVVVSLWPSQTQCNPHSKYLTSCHIPSH